MKIKDLYCTLVNGGGFSLNPSTLAPYEYGGYAVGGGDYKSNYEQHIGDITLNEFKSVIERIIHECEYAGKDVVIGGWVSANGNCFLEISDVYLSRAQAIDVGMMRDEISIWDFYEQKEIKLKNESKDI
jgi:hypothetical protein